MRSGGGRQIDEIDSLGGPIQFFLDDRTAASRQRIGHYQRPCAHSPASILIHLQYRTFAKIARHDACAFPRLLAEIFLAGAATSAHAPPCGYLALPLARQCSAASRRRDERIKRQRPLKGMKISSHVQG